MKEMKFRVHSKEHSKAIQERLFELGYGWMGYLKKELMCLHEQHLFTDKSGCLTYTNEANYFNGHHAEETTLDDLFKIKENPTLEVRGLEYEIEIKEANVHVGCQVIAKQDARKIANFFLEHIKEEV